MVQNYVNFNYKNKNKNKNEKKKIENIDHFNPKLLATHTWPH